MTKSSQSNRIYYGWYILAVSFLILFFGLTFRQSFQIFFKPIQSEFQLSRAALSLPVSLSLILFGVAQPVGGLLITRFSSRIVITLGVLLTGIAVLGMSQLNSVWGIYIFFGILLGLGGTGNSFTSVTPVLSAWFQERRGRAFSIAACGSSLGQLIMIPVLAVMVASLGWRSTYLWTGALFLIISVPLCIFVIRNRPEEIGLSASDGEAPSSKSGLSRTVPYDLPWVQCLSKMPFVLLLTSFFTCGFTVTIIAVHWVPFATDLGFSLTVAATAYALGGGLNTVGVLVVGPLSDRLGRKVPLSLVYLFRGSGFLLFIFFKNDITVWATPMMIGLSWIATVPLTSALTADFFGARNVGVLFGLISLSHQIGSGLGAWLAGYIFDMTGSYDIAFALATYLCVQAAVLSVLINEKQTRTTPPSTEPAPA